MVFFLRSGLITVTLTDWGTLRVTGDRLIMFSSGLLIKGKTSMNNLVGMGSSIHVDDLDEDNVVISL